MNNIPSVLIAAGASRRMGQPKQLLPWNRHTLIEHQVITLLTSSQEVYVILGAYADQIRPILKNYPVNIIQCEDWEKGMGNSLSYGIRKIRKEVEAIDGILISLIDQPLINHEHLQILRSIFKTGGREIIASASSQGWAGVPALFSAHYLAALASLKGEEGAKKIINAESKNIIKVQGEDLLVDMDTLEIYQELFQKFSLQ